MEVAGIDAVGRGERDLHIALGGTVPRQYRLVGLTLRSRPGDNSAAVSPRLGHRPAAGLDYPMPSETARSALTDYGLWRLWPIHRRSE